MAGYLPSLRISALRLTLAGSAMLACAAPLQAGDGSGTSNPDLLRGSYSSQCMDARYCNPGQVVPPPSYSVPETTGAIGNTTGQRPANCEQLIAQQIYVPECAEQLGRPQPQPPTVPARYPAPQPVPVRVDMPSAPAPVQPARLPENMKRAAETSPYPVRHNAPRANIFSDDAVQADWSVTLRGSVVKDSDATTIETSLVPEGSVTFLAPGSSATLRGSAKLVQEGLGHFRIGSGNVGLTATSAVSRDTDFNASADLELSQDRAGSSSSTPSVTSEPLIATGTASAGILHDFGPLRAGVTVSALREIVGQTQYSDGSSVDNAGRSRTGLGVSGRLEMRLSPILSSFADVSVDREFYDAASASLGVKQDAWTYSGRAGLSADWGNGITASGSLGYGLRKFDDPALTEAGSFLYGARIGYVTSDQLNLAAALDSSISPSGDTSGASVRFDHSVRLEARYQVNSWITGRASGGYNWAEFSGITEMETGYEAGVGLDMLISDNLSMSADYGYDYVTDTSGTGEGTHTISLGITASR